MKRSRHLQADPFPGERRAVLRAVFHRHGGRCFYCDRPTTLRKTPVGKRHAADTATFDHVITASAGGAHETENGVLACFACNNRRGMLAFGAFAVTSHGRHRLSGDRGAPPAALKLIADALAAWAEGKPLTATPGPLLGSSDDAGER